MWIFCRLFYVLDSVERQTKMITHQLQIIRANCVSVVSMVPGTEKGDFFPHIRLLLRARHPTDGYFCLNQRKARLIQSQNA